MHIAILLSDGGQWMWVT